MFWRKNSRPSTSSDLELVNDGATNAQKVGLRFTGIGIPQGATISKAYVQFITDEVGSATTSLLVRGEDADDAAAFGTGKNNVSLRQTTDASASWTPAAWTVVNQADAAQRSPDLSAIVQEIVARPGWLAGNDLDLIITGSGTRTARAFESGAAMAPLLHVEWAPGEPDETPPTVSMTQPAEGSTVAGTVRLSAAASDNVTVASVQFRLDSQPVGQPDTTAPYSFDLDTAQQSNGTVAISAVAADAAGNQTISDPITVTIDNSGPEPPPPPPPLGMIRVPEDYPTIQQAINAAGNGDMVVVGPGTYPGGLVISGKSITLASQYHTTGDSSLVDQTIISGGSPGVNVDISAPNTVVKGFHFLGGVKSIQFFAPGGQILDSFFDNAGSDAISFEDVGGIARGNRVVGPGDDGVDIDAASSDVLIENNIFELADDDGIEIRNQNYTGPHVTHTIRNNTIIGSAEDGIQIIDYSANSSRSFVIERNLVRTSAGAGLGLMDNGETVEDFRAASVPERILVLNNTFDGNRCGITGGDNLIAVNNIISNSSVLGLKNVDAGSVAAHTLFFGNALDQAGSNVDAATTRTGDPLYTGAFALQPGSPAIDGGAAAYSHDGQPAFDIPPSDYSGASPDLGWREFLLV